MYFTIFFFAKNKRLKFSIKKRNKKYIIYYLKNGSLRTKLKN